jgi:lysozyme
MSKEHMLDIVRAELVRDEGVVLHAYEDSLGFLTIGVGRLIDKRKGGGLSRAEVAMLLDNDIENKVNDLDRHLPWWNNLDDVRKRALLNVCFQIGIGDSAKGTGLLGFKNTLAALKRGDYKAAAAGLRASKLYQQTPARTERRAKMIETGEDK